ncbi:ABC transporter transmembrane domain-containing protein, partial [Klebsiella pneumoniae]|nr:ABC transporter transmembrane domain-containing protein [Klebsiella pneumoniae]
IMTFGQKIGRTRQDSLANFQGIASESLSEIRLVKSSNAEKQASKKAENDVNALYKIGVKEAIFDGLMSPVMMLSMMLMIFGLLAYGIYLISTGV